MTLKGYSWIASTDTNVDRLQYRLEETFKAVTDSSIIDGNIVEDIDLASGTTTKVAHKLGRNLRGWVVVGRTAAQHVYDANAGKTDLDQFLHLTAGGTVTVNIWVF